MVLTIKEVMDTRFLAADGGLTVDEAARRMVESRHGYLLILDGGRPTGILTEWDLVEKVLAAGRDPRTTPVDAIASRPVMSVDGGTPTTDVVEMMVKRGVRRMVITENGAVVGVVGGKDVLRIFRSYVDRISAEIARLQSSFP
ncbi:MAG TPA: CBS domain-containing protein [Thermoplasmata archaeon]|nr:CBS domain-containing protein [Thermoplasmata archaeon]